ncbi:hypothetical protein RFI_20852 [Reticulomyxa filosa]|uniref:Uncharacterized protein n=1 Tax=Reticulomyxa filosa TaxID=46433 RepID=X6MSS2_RETFI|nr:hypothetical protein RFI_20852 [Reticulomyxa filosa]|eukprot:ETO16492.1 hypothetical protein RFI_20852 [Reticulomyxa filosa]
MVQLNPMEEMVMNIMIKVTVMEVLIEFQSQDQFSSQLNTNISKQIFGIITCIGGNKYQKTKVEKTELQFIVLNDKMIRIWETNSRKLVQTLIGHLEGVLSGKYSPDDKMIVSLSRDKKIILWNAKSGDILKLLIGHSNYVMRAAFSPNSQFIVSCSYDGTIRIWDVVSGKQLKIFSEQSYFVNDVKYFSNGQMIVCSDNKTIRLLDVKEGYEIQKLE